MNLVINQPQLTNIFPFGTQVKWDNNDVDTICDQLIGITKNVEFRTRNLELAIKSVANIDKKAVMKKNLNQIFSKWYDNCKRLGVVPIGVYRCKIMMNSGHTMYWEFPSGLIAPPTESAK